MTFGSGMIYGVVGTDVVACHMQGSFLGAVPFFNYLRGASSATCTCRPAASLCKRFMEALTFKLLGPAQVTVGQESATMNGSVIFMHLGLRALEDLPQLRGSDSHS